MNCVGGDYVSSLNPGMIILVIVVVETCSSGQLVILGSFAATESGGLVATDK